MEVTLIFKDDREVIKNVTFAVVDYKDSKNQITYIDDRERVAHITDSIKIVGADGKIYIDMEYVREMFISKY